MPVPPCHPCAETESGLLPFEGVLHFGGAQRWWRMPPSSPENEERHRPKKGRPRGDSSDVFMSVNEI